MSWALCFCGSDVMQIHIADQVEPAMLKIEGMLQKIDRLHLQRHRGATSKAFWSGKSLGNWISSWRGTQGTAKRRQPLRFVWGVPRTSTTSSCIN